MATAKGKGIRHQVLAFDIYGTILNTNGLNAALQSHLHVSKQKAAQLSLLWRKYQLEYTWRLNAMKTYEPFDAVTKNALLHALGEEDIPASDDTVCSLMMLYDQLPPFDDAVSALRELSQIPHVKIVIFSNGTHGMVTSALQTASVAELPAYLHLADDIRVYKPAKEIYESLLSRLNADLADGARDGYTGDDIWLVSGNPFDVTGARNAGLQAFWVNREGKDWIDHATSLKPSAVVTSLMELVDTVKRVG